MQPRNYFTDAADWFLKRNPDPQILSGAEYSAVKERVEHWVKNGICFTLPTSGRILSDEDLKKVDLMDEGLLRLPYPVCILEYTSSDSAGRLKLVIVVEMVGDTIFIDMMTAASGGVWTPPAMTAESTIGDRQYTVRTRMPEYIHNKEADWAKGRVFKDDAKIMLQSLALSPVYEFVHAINFFHTTFDDIPPPERLNRKRLKRGEVPLFTYKVLTVGKKKRKSQHLGGTHASPRSHLRRGYYRTSQKGIRHWVQPCMVRGETDGFVHKDYRVEAIEA